MCDFIHFCVFVYEKKYYVVRERENTEINIGRANHSFPGIKQ